MKKLSIGVALGLFVGAAFTAWAAQTNYLGTVFVADPTTPTRQMTVNADGSVPVALTSSSALPTGASTAANQTAILAAIQASAIVPPLPITGTVGADGSTSIASGGVAQNLFSGVTPTNGYEVCNPDPTEELWISDSTTASANGQGSIKIGAGGNGCYSTADTMRPFHAVSIYGATTAHKVTARSW